MAQICQRAYAKINLSLSVGERCANGYHSLTSVMQTIALWDEITVSLFDKKDAGDASILLTCNLPNLPCDENNLVYKAAELYLQETRLDLGMKGLQIRLYKKIPVAAGLGGGSSDAAATLRALNRFLPSEFPVSLPKEIPFARLLALSSRLGSDVPFFLVGGTCWVEGCGEKVQRLNSPIMGYVVLVKPDFGISTPQSFARLDELRAVKSPRIVVQKPLSVQSFASQKFPDVSLLYNDLEAPAFEAHPILRHIKEDMNRHGARFSLLCGSGSTVFGFFSDEEEAKICFRFMKKYYGSRYSVMEKELFHPGYKERRSIQR